MSRFDEKACEGRWPSILTALGVPAGLLNKRNQPCPFCDGKDRFRFTDHKGAGMWLCNVCRPCGGNGVHFVMEQFGVDFKGAAKMIESVLPSARATAPAKLPNRRPLAGRRWTQSNKCVEGDPVWKYLTKRRVLTEHGVPDALRHECIDGKHAMIAVVRDKTRQGQTIHITYLTPDGDKDPSAEVAKRVLSAMGESPRIELYRGSDGILCVAEGIETAMAVRSITGLPVWSLISTAGFRNFVPPAGLRRLEIYGDNDASFAGQAAAYALAERMSAAGIAVSVQIPEEVGTDWADHV